MAQSPTPLRVDSSVRAWSERGRGEERGWGTLSYGTSMIPFFVIPHSLREERGFFLASDAFAQVEPQSSA